jgi:glyoxylase-like metal-dependent hydrolase (beta-lactamase superfamily II)
MKVRRIGDLEIGRVLEQVTPFDRQAFFPDTTQADWAPHLGWLEPDAIDPVSGDMLLPMQSYLVRTRHHTILIDSCIGNDKDRPTRPNWHRKHDDVYMTALAAHGVAPGDIDFVLCTHLHPDHVGWNTRLRDGRWVPTFPNARYVLSRKEVEAWDAGVDGFTKQQYEDSVLPVIRAGLADLVSNDHALDDEVWLEPTPGHTPDHVAIALASRGESAVMCGDLVHCPVQCLHPEWRPRPDWDAAIAQATRRAFLERYCDTDTLVCTAHFPLPSAGHVVARGDAFGFEYDGHDW